MGEAVETDNETLKKRLLYFVRRDYLAESEVFTCCVPTITNTA